MCRLTSSDPSGQRAALLKERSPRGRPGIAAGEICPKLDALDAALKFSLGLG
jgi:hypothetical protein